MGKITISTLDRMKANGEKFVCITAYDATFARIISEVGAETILVGDSLGMVLQGHESTIPVTIGDMAYHTRCVCRAKPQSLVIADLPFMSYTTAQQAMDSATQLIQAGAHMVKMGGGTWLSGTRLAPAKPCRKRNSTSISRLADRPQPIDASVKKSTDPAMIRPRPKRSASQPESGVAMAPATR